MKVYWTEQDFEILHRCYPSGGPKSLQEQMARPSRPVRSRGVIQGVAHRRDVKCPRLGKPCKATLAQIEKTLAALRSEYRGARLKQSFIHLAASRLGCSVATVRVPRKDHMMRRRAAAKEAT